jgi:hypothetical protein
MSRIPWLAGTVIAASALFGTTASAQATCYSSTPSSTVFADPFDGEAGLAPEITTVEARVDGACNYTVTPGVDPLIDGDSVFIWIDSDGNAATGSPTFGGADTVVGTLGATGADNPPLRGVWNGTTFTFTDTTPVGTVPAPGGFTANVDRLPIASGLTTRMMISSMYKGTYKSYIDVAPNPGMGTISLPVAFSTSPPPPPSSPAPVPAPGPVAAPAAPPAPAPAPTRTAPTATPPASPTTAPAATCVVPGAKRLTVGKARTRLAQHGCRLASSPIRAYSSTVKAGRVIRTNPSAGSVTSTQVRLVVSRGKKRRTGRAAAVDQLSRLNALVRLADQEQAALQR